jgi:5'/3'-nucleotidase
VRALVTNDDGVDSDGVRTLAAVVRDAGLETVVVAPGWDSSGASASLTSVLRDGRSMISERPDVGPDGVRTFAVEGSPAFIVRTAATGAFGAPPDVVVSGINGGLNTGHAVLHSGTVGAALTAATFGLPAMAVSIDVRGGGPVRWSRPATWRR